MSKLIVDRLSFLALLGCTPFACLAGCARHARDDRPRVICPSPIESTRLPLFERLWSAPARDACVMPSGDVIIASGRELLVTDGPAVPIRLRDFDDSEPLAVASLGVDSCIVALSDGSVAALSADGSVVWRRSILDAAWMESRGCVGLHALSILVDSPHAFVMFTGTADEPSSVFACLDIGSGDIEWRQELLASGYDVTGVRGWRGLEEAGFILSTVAQGMVATYSADSGVEISVLDEAGRMSGAPLRLDDDGYCLQLTDGSLIIVDMSNGRLSLRARGPYGGSAGLSECNSGIRPVQIDDSLLCRVPLGSSDGAFGLGIVDIKSLEAIEVVHRAEVDIQPLVFFVDDESVLFFASEGAIWRADISDSGVSQPRKIADARGLDAAGVVRTPIWNKRKEQLLVFDGHHSIHCYA